MIFEMSAPCTTDSTTTGLAEAGLVEADLCAFCAKATHAATKSIDVARMIKIIGFPAEIFTTSGAGDGRARAPLLPRVFPFVRQFWLGLTIMKLEEPRTGTLTDGYKISLETVAVA